MQNYFTLESMVYKSIAWRMEFRIAMSLKKFGWRQIIIVSYIERITQLGVDWGFDD